MDCLQRVVGWLWSETYNQCSMKTELIGDSLLRVASWERELPWLWHGFSTRLGGVSVVYGAEDERGGDLNLGFTVEDEAERVRENRRRLVERATGSAETRLAMIRQVHSGVSVELRVDEPLWSDASEADGVMSNQAGVLLAVQTADCIPVLVADPDRRVVAAFHAGWRGTAQRIVEHGVAQMRARFGCAPERLVAAIGPGIGGCCYTVGEELQARFGEQFAYAQTLFRRTARGLFLDLTEANRRQLLEAGVLSDRIEQVGGCTACQPERFFSHRAQRGRTGRMMSVIGIAP